MEQLLTIAPFALVVLLLGGVLWLARPDVLALLVWPVVLLYPKRLMHGALPLNAGVNDVFMVLLAIRMLFYQYPSDLPYYRWGGPVVALAAGMALMQVFSEASGALFYPMPGLWLQTLRDGLKGLVFVSFAFVLVRSVTSEVQVRRHVVVFLGTLTVAFFLVWVSSWAPSVRKVFEDLGSETRARELAYVQSTRTWGPFEFTTGLGIMIAATVPLGLALAAAAGAGAASRVGGAAMVALAGVAEILTKSRSALTGICFVLLIWVLGSNRRWRILAALAVIAGVVVVYAVNSRDASKLQARVEADKLVADSALRTDLWKTMVTNPSPLVLGFGEGQFVIAQRLNLNPHNGYLGALFVWGVGGVLMFVLLYAAAVRWGRQVKALDRSALGRGFALGALGSTVSIAVTALTSDPWFTSDYRFLVYFMLALLWQRRQAVMMSEMPAGISPEYGMAPDSYYDGAVAGSY
jgi:O-antigen ligase/polysaccharide polymerase Wzy-like membrane protein